MFVIEKSSLLFVILILFKNYTRIFLLVEDAGGRCLPCVVDIRNEEQVEVAVKSAVEKFGGIDILVNNASAIHLTTTVDTPMKKYDLMNSVNARGTFLV